VENEASSDLTGADSMARGGLSTEPSLPPRKASDDDLWSGVEAEPATQFHHVDLTPRRPGVWLLPTRAARLMVTIGCMGGVLTTLLLLAALMPAFDTGDSRGFLIPLDENPWYAASLIVSSLVTGLGWLWWTLSASFNAERIVPLATSPWLPTFVYLGGPIATLIGLDMVTDMAPVVVGAGVTWVGIGHIVVVASFRSTAERIGASTEAFTKLLWLPLAWISYRMGMVTLLTFLEDEQQLTWLLMAIGYIGVLFPVAMVVAAWNAMASFERACRRLNLRTLGIELPVRELLRERSMRN
jgi:hypothetical protein